LRRCDHSMMRSTSMSSTLSAARLQYTNVARMGAAWSKSGAPGKPYSSNMGKLTSSLPGRPCLPNTASRVAHLANWGKPALESHRRRAIQRFTATTMWCAAGLDQALAVRATNGPLVWLSANRSITMPRHQIKYTRWACQHTGCAEGSGSVPFCPAARCAIASFQTSSTKM